MRGAEAARLRPGRARQGLLAAADLIAHRLHVEMPELAIRVQHGVIGVGLSMVGNLVSRLGGGSICRRRKLHQRPHAKKGSLRARAIEQVKQRRKRIRVRLVIKVKAQGQSRFAGRHWPRRGRRAPAAAARPKESAGSASD